jgi:hypothetical protein
MNTQRSIIILDFREKEMDPPPRKRGRPRKYVIN